MVNLPKITELLAQRDRNPGLTLKHGLEITVMVCFCMIQELRIAFKFLKVYSRVFTVLTTNLMTYVVIVT